MEVTLTKRIFKFKDLILQDPNRKYSVDEVITHYSNLYPELTNATGQHEKYVDNEEHIKISTNTASKG